MRKGSRVGRPRFEAGRWARPALAGAFGLGLLFAGVGEVDAQQEGLAAYDYENLRFRGIAGEAFFIDPSDIESTIGWAARIDLGFLGPKVRMQARGGYWSSNLVQSEVDEFEQRIEDLVEEQNGPPRPSIDLGQIDRSDIFFGVDLHWMFNPDAHLRPYLGLGAELHVLSGSGAAIDGTFVDDSLDLVTAGGSAIAGLEFGLGSVVSIYGEGRGSLAANIRSLGFAAGLLITWN